MQVKQGNPNRAVCFYFIILLEYNTRKFYWKKEVLILKEDKRILYFNMVLGTIGTILIILAAIRYLIKENDNTGYALIIFGFILTIGYINYLENKAGISKKLTWIRVIISLILFFSFSYFLYY